MKKLITILLFGMIALVSYSQSTAKTYATKSISTSVWSWNISTGAADSLGVVQDTIIIPIKINMQDSVKGFYRIKLKEVVSPARIVVEFQSKKHNLGSYTSRTSITYTGEGTDSTIYIKTQAPDLSDPFQRLLIRRVNNKAYIEDASAWYLK